MESSGVEPSRRELVVGMPGLTVDSPILFLSSV